VGITGSSSSRMLALGPEPFRDPLVRKFTVSNRKDLTGTGKPRRKQGERVSGGCV
jgi:hypothetical protein